MRLRNLPSHDLDFVSIVLPSWLRRAWQLQNRLLRKALFDQSGSLLAPVFFLEDSRGNIALNQAGLSCFHAIFPLTAGTVKLMLLHIFRNTRARARGTR